MFNWRITKYNPKLRNASGEYLKNEWTSSFSDIEKFYENKKFTLDDYLVVENTYVATILLFMSCENISTLKICCLEKQIPCSSNSTELLNTFTKIKNNTIIDKKIIALVSRLALREELWCKLESDKMYVHFGYDYYMYIGTSKPCEDILFVVEQLGLFIEPFQSPYST